MHFRCLENCGMCCSYKVALLPADIRRIVKKGYDKDEFSDNEFLLKKGGYCVFLGQDLKCAIYEERPAYCRAFPFYVEGDEIDIDLSCPGVGQGSEFRIKSDEYPSHGVQKIKDEVLQKLPGYVSEDRFKEVGLAWCESLLETDLSPSSILPAPFINKGGVRGTGGARLPARQGDMWECIFSITDGRGTHFTPEGEIVRYQFDLKDSIFKIENHTYQLRESSNPIPLPINTLKKLVDYLRFWFGRGIFYRFCLVSSVGIPRPESPFAVAFAFITKLSERIVMLKNALSLHWEVNESNVHEENMLREAIRAVDGRLRTKCQSARISQWSIEEGSL